MAHASRLMGWWMLAAMLLGSGCLSQDETRQRPGLLYAETVRTEPRPLRFHQVRIDLTAEGLEIAVAVPDDPDGDGPAETLILDPVATAEAHRLIVAVNANAFQVLEKGDPKAVTSYPLNSTVDILGLAAEDGHLRSPAQKGYVAFWIDADGKPQIGQPAAGDAILAGCAGFGWLILDGEIAPKEGGPLHPRTAVGFDRERRFLWLVVVDGRQPGYSEGVTTAELAAYMKELGCHQAVNLDGGGSTILMMAEEKGMAVLNRPSTRLLGRSLLRPVPVLLGVRATAR